MPRCNYFLDIYYFSLKEGSHVKQKHKDLVWTGGLVIVMLGILILIGSNVTAQSSGSSSTDNVDPFYTILEVVTSPRCMNCHPTDNQPRQTDAQYKHLFGVVRGVDNHGGAVLHCESCHHEENNPYSNVPGAPHWVLAPRSMGWLGLSDAEIARTLVDLEKNGGRTAEDLVEHMSTDALVLWAWDAGEGRNPPPVPFDDFVDALNLWLEQGAELPEEFRLDETSETTEGATDGSN